MFDTALNSFHPSKRTSNCIFANTHHIPATSAQCPWKISTPVCFGKECIKHDSARSLALYFVRSEAVCIVGRGSPGYVSIYPFDETAISESLISRIFDPPSDQATDTIIHKSFLARDTLQSSLISLRVPSDFPGEACYSLIPTTPWVSFVCWQNYETYRIE